MNEFIEPTNSEPKFFSVTEILLFIFKNHQKMTSQEFNKYFMEKGMVAINTIDNSYELGFSNMLLHVGQLIMNKSEKISTIYIKVFYNNDNVPKSKNKIIAYFIKHSRMRYVNIDFKFTNEFVKNYYKNFYPNTKHKKLFYPGDGITPRGISINYYNDKISIIIKKFYDDLMDTLSVEIKK
jgi:hypothetical protein